MTKKKSLGIRREVDFTLLMATIILVFIGIIMVFSASWPEAMQKYNDGYRFLKRQLFSAGIGLFMLFVCMNINYKFYRKYALLIFVFSLFLGLMVFSPLGYEAKGARRWIDLGFISFMPSDTIKIASIIYLANFLANKKKVISTFAQGTLPAFLIIGMACGVIFIQNDLSTAVTLAATLMIMFFVGGMNLINIPLVLGAGGSLLYIATRGEKGAFRLERIAVFKDPFQDKLGFGWQAVQSLYALGSGGLFGLGLGKSKQKFFYIPESYNDFILSIIGEELGFLGTFLICLIFMILIWRGIKIALHIEDSFGRYLATGITTLIAIQSLIHLAVVTSSMPTTGITLPFVSYGGTSLMVYMSAVGILLNISRHANLDGS